MKPILIVEDEAIMRDSLKDWLTNGGYQVETAEDGSKALETIKEKDFDVVILDLRLPGKNGIEVLKEVKEKKPQIKGIIMTAFPSVQTTVEAMKAGAIDYLSKPFDLNELEKLIQNTLGPVQVEIRAKEAVKEVTPEPAAVVEEVITVTPADIPAHIQQGKDHYNAGQYQQAQKEFKAVLGVAPANIEARVWLHKAQMALANPEALAAAGEAGVAAKPKECLWVRMGMVAQRICTNDYNCITCEFDQQMQEKMASGESPELDAALEKLKALSGNQRLCRYALKGEVSYRLCSRLFHCATCEFGQMQEEALQQKLAKLAVRREALRKKEEKAKAQ
jgi:DNA-binding response OmpR family regulator